MASSSDSKKLFFDKPYFSSTDVTVKEVISFIDKVKNSYSENMNKFDEFLELMKDYKKKKIDAYQLINGVSILFNDKKELLSTFKKFCPKTEPRKFTSFIKPPIYRPMIKSVQPVSRQMAHQFIRECNKILPNKEYNIFINDLRLVRNSTEKTLILQKIEGILEDFPYLLKKFYAFIPNNNLDQLLEKVCTCPELLKCKDIKSSKKSICKNIIKLFNMYTNNLLNKSLLVNLLCEIIKEEDHHLIMKIFKYSEKSQRVGSYVIYGDRKKYIQIEGNPHYNNIPLTESQVLYQRVEDLQCNINILIYRLLCTIDFIYKKNYAEIPYYVYWTADYIYAENKITDNINAILTNEECKETFLNRLFTTVNQMMEEAHNSEQVYIEELNKRQRRFGANIEYFAKDIKNEYYEFSLTCVSLDILRNINPVIHELLSELFRANKIQVRREFLDILNFIRTVNLLGRDKQYIYNNIINIINDKYIPEFLFKNQYRPFTLYHYDFNNMRNFDYRGEELTISIEKKERSMFSQGELCIIENGECVNCYYKNEKKREYVYSISIEE